MGNGSDGNFLMSRGLSPDERPLQEKPYSAASYTAQYGVPLEDTQAYVERSKSHGEVLILIGREHLADESFCERAREHVLRPYS